MSGERRLGEARNDQERAIEAAIARIEAWQGRPASYQLLVGGVSNSNWRVTVEGHARRYFVKIPGAGTEAFVDRNVANEAGRLAHAMGIGPEIVHFDPSDGLEVAEFLEGYRALTNADFDDPAMQEGVIGLYRRFNANRQLSQTKTIFDMIDQHIEQAHALGCLMPPDLDWLLAQYAAAKAAFHASGLDLAPCFNDPMPGNFLVGDGLPMKLIDYEFASNNERAYELGVFLGEMFFPEDRSIELVEAYYGDARPATVARVWVARALADVKWGFWGIIQRRLSAWNFDYQKYGDWKFMRARSVILDPRWSGWLRSI